LASVSHARVTSVLTLSWGIFGEAQYNQWTVGGSNGDEVFSALPLRPLRLCGFRVMHLMHRRNAENAKVAQRLH